MENKTIINAFNELKDVGEETNFPSIDEVKEIALDKPVKYQNRNWVINDVELRDLVYTFFLKPAKGRVEGRTGIGAKTITSGRATTTDQALNDLCNEIVGEIDKDRKAKADAEEQKRLNDIKDREERERAEAEQKKQDTIEAAKADAANGNREVYKLLTGKKRFSDKAKDLEYRYDINLYIKTFEEEEANQRREKLAKSRATGALADYPGDLEKLLKWMKKNAVSLTVMANAQVGEREQAALDNINEKNGTDYKVTITDSDYPFPAYKIHFKNIETAPEEFRNWIIKKHSDETKDLSVWVDKPAVNDKGDLTSNDVCKDLIFNPSYDFHIK